MLDWNLSIYTSFALSHTNFSIIYGIIDDSYLINPVTESGSNDIPDTMLDIRNITLYISYVILNKK
jgi:hypothetical protein